MALRNNPRPITSRGTNKPEAPVPHHQLISQNAKKDGRLRERGLVKSSRH